MNNDIELVRVGFNISKEVKEWYMREAKRYAMPMASLMSMVLTKNYEAQQNVEIMKEMNECMQIIKSMDSEGVDYKQMNADVKEFTKLMVKLDEKESAK